MTDVHGTTRVVALLGDPVDHSRSPAMHNAAFADLGLDLVYVALPTPAAQVATVLAALKAVRAAGGNVTVPHKRAVHALCDDLTAEAAALGAVNTFWWDDRGWLHGDNTDVAGIATDLDDMAPPPGPAVVLGTGGAARAAVLALVRQGREVTVVGRRATAADTVATTVAAHTPDGPRPTSVALADQDAVARVLASAALVVNATPLGLDGESLPAPFDDLPDGVALYDCVYARDGTPAVRAVRGAGGTARDGRGMLLHQAAAAFHRWTGVPGPVDVMRTALDDALGDG